MSTEIKRQKLNDAPVDLDFNTKTIPIEIWNEVFVFATEKNDLKNLSLVCKHFYEIIGQLPDLMNRFTLKLGSYSTGTGVQNSSRIYKHLRLSSIEEDYDHEEDRASGNVYEFSKVLERFGPHVETLKFSNCNLDYLEWAYVLSLTQKNLKELRLSESDEQSSWNSCRRFEINDNFQLTELKYLAMKYISNSTILKFVPYTLQKFKFSYAKYDEKELKNYEEFLQRQKNLKYLKLRLEKYQFPLLKLFDAKKLKFQLETLIVILTENVDMSENFSNFLKSQAKSLKTLKLINLSVHQQNKTFKDMPRLETLEIQCNRVKQYKVGLNFNCPSLKQLSFRFPVKTEADDASLSYLNFIRRFADCNLEEIVLKIKNDRHCLPTLAELFPDLKKLTIDNFIDENFERHHSDPPIPIVFRNLRVLVLDRGYNIYKRRSNINKIFEGLKNVEVLIIRKQMIITAKTLVWLLIHMDNLKHLEIDRGYDFKNSLLCKVVYLFKGLRFLNISEIKGPVEEFKQLLSQQYPNLKYHLSSAKVEKYITDTSGEYYSEVYTEDEYDSDSHDDNS